MNEDHEAARQRQGWNPARSEPPRLALVRSGVSPVAPRAAALRIESTFACPSRLRIVGRSRVAPCEGKDDEQRRRVDRQEGKQMDRMEGFIYSMSRFVFGLGIGLALTSTFVIVTSRSDLLGPRPAAADVVRLDPVVVTIAAERFDAIRTEVEPPSRIGHVYGGGPPTV